MKNNPFPFSLDEMQKQVTSLQRLRYTDAGRSYRGYGCLIKIANPAEGEAVIKALGATKTLSTSSESKGWQNGFTLSDPTIAGVTCAVESRTEGLVLTVCSYHEYADYHYSFADALKVDRFLLGQQLRFDENHGTVTPQNYPEFWANDLNALMKRLKIHY